jgi:hypothetical protein
MTPDPRDTVVDEIVDEVAGSLTAGEPRADFTSRVMARIEGSRDTPRRGWRPAWLLVPPTAAAIVAMLIFPAHDTRPPGAGRVATAQQPAAPRPADRSATQATHVAAATAARAVRTRASVSAPRPSPYALDPLVTAGIGVTPLTIDRLSTDPIAIDLLDPITSVDVAPLTVDDPQRRQE